MSNLIQINNYPVIAMLQLHHDKHLFAVILDRSDQPSSYHEHPYVVALWEAGESFWISGEYELSLTEAVLAMNRRAGIAYRNGNKYANITGAEVI